MEIFSCKTRLNTEWTEKPKVFFCCHPDDYTRIFDKVSNDILDSQNCGVWYFKDPHISRNAIDGDLLKSMNLFVVAVTTAFLTTENPARLFDFSFAKEQHIPILPILMEDGLQTLFNTTCGELQCLSRFGMDMKAMLYSTKLEKFLSSVLYDQSDVERMREAFLKRIFLSYRKTDIAHARKLIKAIRQTEGYDGVSIWFDEYLIIGENFNDLIEQQIERCDLFVLTVTPQTPKDVTDKNGHSKHNYIVEYEYPKARRARKPIVAVEMLPTNEAELQKKYDGLPKCVFGKQAEELAQALQATLPLPAQTAYTKERLFYIGLAYLMGFEVETDQKKAADYILKAAKKQHIPAMEKLVDMYRLGHGVEKDSRQALAWTERAADAAERIFKTAPDVEALIVLARVLINGASYYAELSLFKKAESTLLKAEAHILESKYANTQFDVMMLLSSCREKLADICIQKGNLKKAVRWLNIAQKTYMETIYYGDDAEPVIERICTSRCESNLALGDCFKNNGNFDKALSYYENALHNNDTLTERKNNCFVRFLRGLIYEKLGDLYMSRGDIRTAHQHYETMIALIENVYGEMQDDAALRALAYCHNRISTSWFASGNLALTKKHLDQSYRISKQFYRSTRGLSDYGNMAFCHSHYGDLYFCRKSFLRASWHYFRALKIREDAVRVDRSMDNLDHLGIACYKCSTIALFGRKHYRERAIEIYKELVKLYPEMYLYQERLERFSKNDYTAQTETLE